MPRRKLPPRLYLRRGRSPGWVIKDGAREIRTGHGPEHGDDAPEMWQALADYIGQRVASPAGPRTPERLKVCEALTYYGREKGPTTADPARIADCITALTPFWGELMVSAVKGETCRRYTREREKRGVMPGTIRRELGCLSAALNHCQREGYLTLAPAVALPERPEGRDRWLTRAEAARLLRAARRHERGRHLARFILVALYTGTRKQAILALQWQPNTEGGHVDLERGVLYRKSAFGRRTRKRQTPARLPRQLLGHLRRWRRISHQHVIEYDGEPVKSIKRTWATARKAAKLGPEVTPHTLKHTAVTWSMQRGGDIWAKASFFGTSRETLERVYAHHHPDHQQSAVAAMERK